MRLLDEVYEELRGTPEGDAGPLQSVLRELLEGPRGNLRDLADRFTQAGLGELMASWIHNGPNLPITASQLRAILGNERTRDFATLAGMPEQELLWSLARHLPRIIDRATPDGELQHRENPGGIPT